MRKTILNYSWILLLTWLMGTLGADAAILPAEQQILQKAGINPNDYDDDQIIVENGHITWLKLEGTGLTSLPLPLLELPYVEIIDLYNNSITGDIGQLVQAYANTNPTLGQHLRILNLNNNQLTGDVGPLVALLNDVPTLEELYLCENHFTDISTLPARDEMDVILDGQHIDLQVDWNPDKQTPAQLMELLPRVARYARWGHSIYDYWDVECYIDDRGIMTIYESGDRFSVWTDGELRLTNGQVVEACCNNVWFRLRVLFTVGDVNFSGTVDEEDISLLQDYIEDDGAWGFNYTAADLNKDQKVNVLDYAVLQHRVKGTTPTATTPGTNTLTIDDLHFYGQEALLPIKVNNANDLVALQFDLALTEGVRSPGWDDHIGERVNDYYFSLSEIGHDRGKVIYRFLLLSPTGGSLLQGHEGEIISLMLQRWTEDELPNSRIEVSNVIFATTDSRNVFTSATTGVINFTRLPDLTVKASKTTVTEGETFQLTISTEEANAKALPITIQSEDNHRFDFPMQTQIPAGQKSVTVEVKTLDDDIPQLDLPNLFTVSAPDFNNAEVLVLLQDNDVPELSLTFDVTEVNELDGDGAVTATLKRTKKTNNKITVVIDDDSNGRLTYAQSTIEMAKNVDEVKFHLGPVDNDDVDGDKTYHVTAAIYVASCDCAVGGESAGYVQATLRVLDDDGASGHQPTRKLADAVVTSITADQNEVEVGGSALFSVIVKNQGTDVLPAVNINIYNEHTGERVATLRTSGALAVNATETLQRRVYLTNVGTQRFYAVVNEDEEVSELRYTNNESPMMTMKVLSPFVARLSTDKKVYVQQDSISITGELMGKDIARASVDIYFINEGYRDVATVVTDADGKFQYKWKPYDYQSGRFVLGACYPGEETDEAMATIDIYGLRRAEHSRISNEITIGETCKGNVMLQNPGVLPLSGVKAQVLSIPDNCKAQLTIPQTIAADGEVPLQFSLLASAPSPERQWEQVKVMITSKEGVQLPLTIYYYAQHAQGSLKATVNEVVTTMVKDQVREYPLVITNTGRGSTGKMTLSLPSCIKSPTGNTLSDLAPGDTTTILLNFVPQESMQLNVPVRGMFGITCEHGIGLTMDFSITPVSNAKGTFIVDVTDELTYYTDEAPHVAGAEVVLRNPVTEALVAQGTTDENGLFSITLPEGYYQLNVTADKHNSYQNNILVDPGVTTEQEVCLTYQAVSVTWEVVETEVEDEYMIVSTLDFEARVPEPVVQLNTVPERIGIDHLAPGESLIYQNILTNKGFITAQDVCLYLPDDDEYFKWEPLAEYEHFDLAAQQSRVIPVRVTRVGDVVAGSRGHRAAASMPCSINERVKLEWPCGDDMHAASVTVNLYYRGDCGDGVGSGGWYPEGLAPGGGSGDPVMEEEGGEIALGGSCNVCLMKMLGVFGDCFMGLFGRALPGLGCLISMVTCGSELADGEISSDDIADCGLGAAGCIVEAFCPQCNLAKLLIGLASCVKSAFDLNECMKGGSGNGSTGGSGIGGYGGSSSSGGSSGGDDGDGDGSRLMAKSQTSNLKSQTSNQSVPRRANVMPSFQEDYMNTLQMLLDVTNASMNQWHEFFGDTIWFNNITRDQFRQLMQTIISQPHGTPFTADQFENCKPEQVKGKKLARFVERLNNTRRFEDTGERSDNMMDMDYIQRMRNAVKDVIFIAIARGYESPVEMFEKETDKFIERSSDEGAGVCATVKLQIKQKMALTRQAFRGTLTIQNGSENTDMQDIKLRLKVVNSNNQQMATAKEFEMHVESLDGFGGDLNFDSGWSLQKGQTGTATIVFIPTKHAAPFEPVDYSFGGTLSYTDPVSGTRVTRELFPATLTVKPSPELDLTYFMQRDIFGDDPLTKDVVEPMVPAEFTVLINNKGNGEAMNVRMVTDQPKIIENEKGLYIDFEILSSQLNGEDKVLAMGKSVATDFGTIAAHSQSWASWELQSTLLGHFIDYNVEATHVTSYGNPDLSLLDQVTIHELIHGFTPATTVSSGSAAGTPRAFLVNDELDFDDTPDALYFSDGTQQQVFLSAYAEIERQRDDNYELRVTPEREGWTYGSVEDPTDGHGSIIRIVRKSDNRELPADNFWITDRTLRDAGAPHYENRLHFIGDMKAEGETYVITFAPRPDVELAVETFTDLPDPEQVITEPLQQLTVRFNKPIDATTFDAADLKLCHEGVPLDISTMPITRLNDTDFRFDLTAYTGATGYYVLTVATADITDSEGFQGHNGKQATWIQLLNGEQGISEPRAIDHDADHSGYSPVRYNIGGRPVGIRTKGLHIIRGKKRVVK